MLATNHALSGALIASVLPLPVAIPVAFASHFVLDAIPHYGIPQRLRNKSRTYRLILVCDVAICFAIGIGLALLYKWQMLACALIAWAPDFLWVLYYFTHSKTLHFRPKNSFMQFHLTIQRWERPWGIAVELLFFITLLPVFLYQMLK